VGGGIIARFFGLQAIKFLAIKALVISFCSVILPIIIMQVIMKLQTLFIGYITSKINEGGIPSVTLQLTGLTGWMANELQIPLCISIILSAVALHFSLRLLRI